MLKLNLPEIYLNYKFHDFSHLELSIYKCIKCNIEIIFGMDGRYHPYGFMQKKMKMVRSDDIYELTCNEQRIKNLLE